MNDILSGLNEPQLEAVKHIHGPLLVLAGAGSGKTRVITRRIAYLVSQGIDPSNILAITFTNKAAGEMQERVASLNTPYGTTVCTFHSLCARLLREFAQYAGLSDNYSIYDRNDQLKVAKQAIEKANLTTGDRITPAKAHGAISNAKNAMMTPHAYETHATEFFERNVSKIYAEYEKILAANNAVDFDDLLMRMAFLLRDNPDIRDYLSQRYRFVLIDEYQDTNHAQYCIARDIAQGHNNICATGDPDQSIYGWRGADISNILDFEKDYPSTKTIRLEENYRSHAPILAAASRLISFNTRRKNKKLFTTKTGGQDVRVVMVDDERAEANLIAEQIEKYRIDGGNYSDIAVFYRANSQSRVIEDALMKKAVPYQIARGVEFYNRKEIKDMLAYLKLINNGVDDVSCERIINTPARGIGAVTIKKLKNFAFDRGGLSLFDAIERVNEVGLSKGAAKKVGDFGTMISKLKGGLDRPVREIMEDVFKLSGLENALKPTDEESRQARGNVEELISAAAEFDDENPDATLAEYLQGVSLVSDVDRWEGRDGTVMLMTLHAAKGLEFPIVFMAGVEEEMLPFSRGPMGFGEAEDRDQIEEERRLAFVGITRAMDQLTLVSARVRTIRGQRLPRTSSRFLDEIGSEDISREDQTTPMSAASHRGGFRSGGFGGGRFGGGKFGGRKSFGDDDWSDFHMAMKGRGKSSEIEDDDDDEIIYVSDADDDYDSAEPEFPFEYENLCKGCMVRHKKFGVGKLVSMSGSWPDTRVEILFHEFGPKKLVLAMAKLEVIG